MKFKEININQLNHRAYEYKQGWKYKCQYKPTVEDLIVMLDQMIKDRKEMIEKVKSL